MDVLTCDFETSYSKDYSLSEMSTWDYITDPRFEVIGVSVKVNGAPAQAFSGTASEVHRFLMQYDWNNSALCAHNAAFDGAILAWHLGIYPKAIIDTWSMCCALHGTQISISLASMAEYYGVGTKGTEREKALGKRRADFTPEQMNDYMAYCCQDSDLTYALFQAIMARGYPPAELRLIDWTIRCYTSGKLRLNSNLIEEALADVRARHAEAWASVNISDPGLLRKDEVLASMLQQFGVDPPKKITPKGNDKYAFAKSDVQFLELREHEDPRVVALVDARLEAKSSIEETRLVSLGQIAEQCGELPFPMTYFGASTGRWSAWDDINLQNLPKKGRIRETIVAPRGKVIIGADLSQIELRILSWVAGQTDILNELRDGIDTYSIMASSIYGYEVNKRDHPTQRFVGKSTVLGCGFGCSHAKLGATIIADAKKYGIVLDDISEDFFKRVVAAYRNKNRMVVRFWEECDKAIWGMLSNSSGYIGRFEYRGNQIMLPRGIPLTFGSLRREVLPRTGKLETVYTRRNPTKRKSADVKLWKGLLTENIVQALARDAFGNSALQCVDNGYEPVGAVHDELLFVVDEHDVDNAMSVIKECMITPPAWLDNCPLDCEIAHGESYAAVK